MYGYKLHIVVSNIMLEGGDFVVVFYMHFMGIFLLHEITKDP